MRYPHDYGNPNFSSNIFYPLEIPKYILMDIDGYGYWLMYIDGYISTISVHYEPLLSSTHHYYPL